MPVSDRSRISLGVLALALSCAALSCAEAPSNANANANTASTANASATASATASPAATAGAAIETREPEQYSATIVLQAEAEGAQQQGMKLPQMEVARSGANRRYAIDVPPLGQIVFLDRADKRYLILPGRRQYAELTPETTGLDVRSMTPGQMAEQLQRLQGVERVGDDQVNGRPVTKYRTAGTARTGSQAGDVPTETFIYVDKETGLPLRVEGSGQSTGNVQGANQGKFVMEMRDIKTAVEPSLFEVPQGYSQITQEQIRQQVGMAAQLLQVLMRGMSMQGGGAAPASSPSPTGP